MGKAAGLSQKQSRDRGIQMRVLGGWGCPEQSSWRTHHFRRIPKDNRSSPGRGSSVGKGVATRLLVQRGLSKELVFTAAAQSWRPERPDAPHVAPPRHATLRRATLCRATSRCAALRHTESILQVSGLPTIQAKRWQRVRLSDSRHSVLMKKGDREKRFWKMAHAPSHSPRPPPHCPGHRSRFPASPRSEQPHGCVNGGCRACRCPDPRTPRAASSA